MQLGTYAVERDYSHYVANASKTVLAIVGTATKGPIGVPTVCTSAQDLINKFGPIKTNCYGLYAGQYFLSQSSKLYFVRAAHTNNTKYDNDGNVIEGETDGTEIAAAASATISGTDSSGTTVSDALTIEFLEKGTYANEYTIKVTQGTPLNEGTEDEVETYTLTLKNLAGATLEVVKNVEIDKLIEGYKSNYFTITHKNTSAVKLAINISHTVSGGNDGIKDIEDADYILAGSALTPETIDMNLFAIPGISAAPVITAMLALAETRGDCLYLVDPPEGLTRDGVVQWHNGKGEYDHSAFNSSYGALYFDWVTIYDSINKVRVAVPPSVVVAATYAYSDRVSELWYAPAGLNRGLISGVVDSITKLSKADMDYLYSEENSINAIYDDPQVGLVLWGQKTLLRTSTALNRVNVRRLLNYLKRVITAACNYLTFEPNDRSTWNSFQMKVEPILKDIVKKRGIYEYQIVKGESIVTDEDIDNYRMPCMISIRPTKAAEEIPIYFTITSTGADFNEVLEANGITVD